jgi:hypothetical protein
MPNSRRPITHDRGMVCPECGSHQSRVTWTVKLPGVVFRYRVCHPQGHRYKTEERVIEFDLPANSLRGKSIGRLLKPL